jgi:hypothetical protein
VCRFLTQQDEIDMKQLPIEITNEQVNQELDMWFSNEECEALARKSGFIQRSTSRLTGSEFFNLLTIEALNEPTISYEGFCDILEERNPNLLITPQALCERMNSQGAVEFLKAGLERTLQETSRGHRATMETAWLSPFSRVLLQDSTQIQVHENMANEFKGSGGNASTASVKIDYSYDVKNEKAEHIAIRQGADSDQGFAEDLTARVNEGDLVIRDLGYFCLNFFAYLVSIGAYFLSRLSFNVNVYLTIDAKEPIKLIQHINRFGDGGKTMEFNVFLGQKHRIPIRLIVYRLPPDVYRTRQKTAIKAAKRKGRSVSMSYLKFLKYTFFITNVPVTLWPMEAVGTIYRLRWQVELVFKNWKSLFQINVLKGTRPERIRCLIYGRLIIILVVQRLLALASAQAANEQRELSFYKATQWLMRGERFLKAFLDRQFECLLQRMLSCLKRLLKQKRKRLTTWSTIALQVGYLDSFVDLAHTIREDLIQADGA